MTLKQKRMVRKDFEAGRKSFLQSMYKKYKEIDTDDLRCEFTLFIVQAMITKTRERLTRKVRPSTALKHALMRNYVGDIDALEIETRNPVAEEPIPSAGSELKGKKSDHKSKDSEGAEEPKVEVEVKVPVNNELEIF